MKKGSKMTKESRERMSRSKTGRVLSDETKLKMSLAKKGKTPKNFLIIQKLAWASSKGRKISDETRQKLRECHKGEKSYLWRGGVSNINKLIRNKSEYKMWRKSVFERDNYTCVFCGDRGIYLQADHIKPFAYFPELRFEIDNGRTLCVPCHKTTDTYMVRARWGNLQKT